MIELDVWKLRVDLAILRDESVLLTVEELKELLDAIENPPRRSRVEDHHGEPCSRCDGIDDDLREAKKDCMLAEEREAKLETQLDDLRGRVDQFMKPRE